MTDETTVPAEQEIIGVDPPPDDQSSGFTDNETLKGANQEQYHGEEPVPGGEESVPGDEQSLPGDEEPISEAEESIPDAEQSLQTTPPPKRKRRRGTMEYDIEDMYPEIGILVAKNKREWNFHDPDIIRALWLESKTNIIEEWKIRHGKVARQKEATEVALNHTAQLRLEHLKQKEEQRKADFRKYHHMLSMGKLAPHFDTVKMATTTTTEMRHKFNRNNPPIPSYYINHYDKYKKPPFKTKINPGRKCKPD